VAISVVVSNFNGSHYLPRLLQTLKSQEGVELEVIVVDRNSTDDSARILAQHSEVRTVNEPPESGLTAGYIAGVKYARNEFLFFCNEDMWFPRDCLRLVKEQIMLSEKIGAVMPYQVRYDGSGIVNTGIWFQRSRWYRGASYPFRRWEFPVLNQPARVSCVNAGACMLSRAAYEVVGGWDAKFFLDHEDDDLAIRLWQKGWECWVQPRALAFHAVGASNSRALDRGQSSVGRKRYIWQHSNELIIILKYFSIRWWWLVVIIWMDLFARDIIRGRFDRAKCDVSVALTTASRLFSVVQFRKRWRLLNRARPGQDFFRVSDFQLQALPEDLHDRPESVIARARSIWRQCGGEPD